MRLKNDFADSPGYWMWLTSRVWQRAINDELKQLGVTMRQFQVLAWLAFEGDLTQAELADRMEVEAATVVGILDRMERDGWIIRAADPHDRRKNVIRPTPQVEPVWNEMTSCLRRVRRKAIGNLSDEHLKLFRSILEQIQENLTGSEPRLAGNKTPSAAARPRAAKVPAAAGQR